MTVDIGICCYNEEKNIGALLETLRSEPMLNEILVVASGCTDRTAEIIRGCGKRDWRITAFIESERSGKPNAVNLILKETKSKILLMESADTLPAKGTISKLVEGFKDHNIGGVAARPIAVNRMDSMADCISLLVWNYLHHTVSENKTRMSGEMFGIRTGLIKSIPPKIIHDDIYIQHSLEQMGYKLRYVPDAIVYMKAPSTMYELAMQRKKNILGYIQLRDDYSGINEVTTSTLSKGLLLLKTLTKIKEKRLLAMVPLAAIIESYANFAAKRSLRNGQLPYGLLSYRLDSTKEQLHR